MADYEYLQSQMEAEDLASKFFLCGEEETSLLLVPPTVLPGKDWHI